MTNKTQDFPPGERRPTIRHRPAVGVTTSKLGHFVHYYQEAVKIRGTFSRNFRFWFIYLTQVKDLNLQPFEIISLEYLFISRFLCYCFLQFQ